MKEQLTLETQTNVLTSNVLTSQGSAAVVISSVEAQEEDKKEEDESDKSPVGSDENRGTEQKKLDVGKNGQRLCSSNEFENEEKRDLQQILMQKLQLSLPEILKDEKT